MWGSIQVLTNQVNKKSFYAFENIDLRGSRTKPPRQKPSVHKHPDKKPLDKNPPCQKPPDKNPPDKTFFSEIL